MSYRIVVAGGGAGGLELVTRLGRTLRKSGRADVTLIDGQMTYLWKPLLHEVAAGSLDAARNEPNFVAQAKWNHFAFQLGTLCELDRNNRLIQLAPILDDLGTELMPTRIRSNGMSVALLINQAVSTGIAGIFLPTVGRFGYSTIFFIFAGCTVVYFVTAFFFLPETKGKTLEEIEAHFSRGQTKA